MESKIKKAYLLIGLLSLLLSLAFVSLSFFRFYEDYLVRNLEEEGKMMAVLFYESVGDKTELLKNISKANPRLRITWLDPQGNVIFESDSNKEKMENHLNRPEIKEALEKGYSSRIRSSVTLSQKVYYYAQKLSDGSILRIARSQSYVQNMIQNIGFSVIGIFLLLFLLSAFLASKMTKLILKPLQQFYEGKEYNGELYPEIAPFLNQINAQKKEIQKQVKDLEEERDKSNLILRNMKEGLVLLSYDQQILSLNERALEIFQAPEEDYRGKHILTLTRKVPVLQLLDQALKEENGSFISEEEGSYFEYSATAVYDKEEEKTGYLLLIADITHRQKAEKMRREFTANVSHELKTPLTSISGFAELMENNMVKEEDIPVFAGKIHKESQRLMDLIEDIIKLSRLDDLEMPKQMEKIDLYEEAKKIQGRMEFAAQQKSISITVEKEGNTVFQGNPRQVEEMLSNLLDNGVKYNVEGGRVRVLIKEKGSMAGKEEEKAVFLKDKRQLVLVVEDSGIGIAPLHQKRIFERFYRADQSRSRQTGGTGLGLSIVSHVVKQYGGTIHLESAEGKGTRITITLPIVEQCWIKEKTDDAKDF